MFRESLLAEYDHEIAATRRMLAQVPVAAMEWRPHHQSRSFAELAAHLTEVLLWSTAILDHQTFDLADAATLLGQADEAGTPGEPGSPVGSAESRQMGALPSESAMARPSVVPEKVKGGSSLVEPFTVAAGDVRRRLDKSDGELTATWILRQDGREVFALPRAAAFRTFVLAHLVHHRGQLSVYLRLNDVVVPPIYGPTATSPRPKHL